MSKEKLKNKGITLIALIITIIVMLILTGVTLSITLGDNGLVNKAKEASEETQVAMDRELLLSAAIGAMGNDGKVNLSAMVLPEGFTGSNGTYTSKNGNTFTVSENGMITISEGPDINENGSVDVEIDFAGIYRGLPDDNDYYMFEVKEGNIIELPNGTEVAPEIDYANKKIYIPMEYEDGSGNHVSETITYRYDLVKENNEIVNIILIYEADDADIKVYWKNENGFEYDLNGTYSDGEKSLTFTENSMYVESSNGYTAYYFKCNEQYYYYGMTMTVDDTKENIGIYEGREIYTKQ